MANEPRQSKSHRSSAQPLADSTGPGGEFLPGEAFVAAVRSGVVRHRRRVRNRVSFATAGLALLVGIGGWYGNHRLSSVERIEVGSVATESDPITAGDPFNLLVLGLDTCNLGDQATDAVCADRLSVATEAEPGLADSITVVRIDPSKETIDLLGVSRDLLVRRSDSVADRKLSSLSIPELPGELRSQLGLSIDHVVTMNMSGFRDAAEKMPLRVNLDVGVMDRTVGLNLQAGCQTLSGESLLALLRSRHLSYMVSESEYRADPTGSVGRRARELQLARIAFEQKSLFSISSVSEIDALLDHISVDEGLSNIDLLRLSQLVQRSTLGSVASLPVTPSGSPTMSFEVVDTAAARELVASMGGNLAEVPVVDSLPTKALAAPVWPKAEPWAGISSC